MTRCSLPKHAQQKSGEERSIHKTENKLKKVVDIIKTPGDVCGTDGKKYARYRDHFSYNEIVTVGFVFYNIRLIDIVRKNRIECSNISGHTAHERCNECSNTDTQQAAWIIVSN